MPSLCTERLYYPQIIELFHHIIYLQFMPTDESKYVTVATYDYPMDMVTAKNLLESAGIHCYAKDELTVEVHNFYSNTIGGIKLQVFEEDVEDAIKIIDSTGYVRETKMESGSSNFEKKLLLFLLVFLAAAILYLFYLYV